jgi:hypothetical protein
MGEKGKKTKKVKIKMLRRRDKSMEWIKRVSCHFSAARKGSKKVINSEQQSESLLFIFFGIRMEDKDRLYSAEKIPEKLHFFQWWFSLDRWEINPYWRDGFLVEKDIQSVFITWEYALTEDNLQNKKMPMTKHQID